MHHELYVGMSASVCVLPGLWTEQYDRIMRWLVPSLSRIATVLDSAAYCYVILPHRPCYSSPRRSYHTSSSAHPGVTRLRPSISTYRTRSFAHPGVSRLRPGTPTSHSATPPSSGSYCMTLSPNRLLLLASHEAPAKVARSCFSCPQVCSYKYLQRYNDVKSSKGFFNPS